MENNQQQDQYSTPLPQGATVGQASNQDQYSTPIPQGATVGQPPTQQNTEDGFEKAAHGLEFKPEDSALTTAGKVVGNAGVGVGETLEGAGAGVLNTLGGVGQGVFQAASKAADTLGLPDKARQFLHHIADDNVAKEENLPPAAKIGYGGETLAEFLMGDEALKALPVAQRLETAAKAIKTVEGSPRLVNALRIGARMLALAGIHGAEGGIVQGAQSAAREQGSIEDKAKEGLKQGAEATAFGTAVGVPLEAGGELLQKAGQVAGKVKNLSQVAEGAKGKQEIVEEMGNRIKASNAQMHTDFETGIKDIKDRLSGQEIDPTDNPLQKKAKELLAKPNPEEHPFVVTAKNATGDKLDKSTKDLLEQLSTGTQPVEKEATAEAPKILDASGKPIQSSKDLAPETKPVKNLNIDDLVALRQQVRTLGDSYELGDINGRVLRKINNALDDTIGQMAQKSGDPTALNDYKELRAGYRDKVNLFDNPVIAALRDGKMDDAAKAFVGLKRAGSALPSAGKANFNTDVLKRVIGADGVKAFGKDVFQTMMKDSLDDGQFNPAKFSEAWTRITDDSKNDLFNVADAKNGLKQLAQDAHAGEQLQHLTRAGVLVPLGAAGGASIAHMGLGALLGLTVAEGGGFAAGRALLNKIATHPEVWNFYQKAGQMAERGAPGTAAKVIAKGATDALNATQSKDKLRDIYSQTSSALQ